MKCCQGQWPCLEVMATMETGFMYESKLVLPIGNFEARLGPTDVKWSVEISHISAGFVKELYITTF